MQTEAVAQVERISKEEKWRPLKISSYEDLLRNEKEILERINRTPNGGHLFLIHPFRMFEEVGVDLSAEARKEILNREPLLENLSTTPFEALKGTKAKQRVTFHIKGLFERREK